MYAQRTLQGRKMQGIPLMKDIICEQKGLKYVTKIGCDMQTTDIFNTYEK